MFNSRLSQLREETSRRLPERQIFHRANGEVKYFNLTTRMQVTALAVAAAVAVWCLVTLLNLIWGNNPLRSPSKELRLAEAEFERRYDDMRRRADKAQQQLIDQQRDFELYTKQLVEKYEVIRRLNGDDLSNTLPIELAANNYSSSSVLMSPRVRDTLPRVSRKGVSAQASIRTGLSIDQSLSSVDHGSNDLLSNGEDEVLDRIERYRAILRATDMSVEDVISSGMGTGGPELPISANATSGFGSRVASIQARIDEAETLEGAVNALPFGFPVGAEYYKTSSYGLRKDPFTKRPTFHPGIDFGSYLNAPIKASSDGIVKKAGPNGGLGRAVTIDHGFGFVTRYGHMQKVLVKPGQVIKKGDVIGKMGSTGRSSGVHLHYEIHFNGRAVDPMKFIKAGQYVQ